MASKPAPAGETFINRLSDDSGSLFSLADLPDVSVSCVALLNFQVLVTQLNDKGFMGSLVAGYISFNCRSMN